MAEQTTGQQTPQQTQQQKLLRDTAWHVQDADQIVSALDTDPERGLSNDEVTARLDRYGPNRIRSGEMVPWWRIMLRQVMDPMIYILIAAAIVSVVFDEVVDAAVILAVVVINGIIGFVQETRARKAIASLAQMTAADAQVIRDGEQRQVPSQDVVPGDIIVLAAGDRVPADARLISVKNLQADEAALTGESAPVAKRGEPVEDEKAVPGDQLSMVFSGTNITRGRARGVVVRTGAASELGHIAAQTQDMAQVQTPIQKKMHALGKAIGVAVVVLALVVVAGGLLVGMDLNEVVRTAVALTVGAVPEALPIVLTVTLAVGVQRMAKRNAIIRSLPAVETLGSTTVIGSDKTGTLTQNQMTVKVIWAAGQRFAVQGSGYDAQGGIEPAQGEAGDEVGKAVRLIALTGLLANEAKGLPQRRDEAARDGGDGDDEDRGHGGNERCRGGGDPTELALLVSAIKAGYELDRTREEHKQIDLIPFESDRQFMATLNDTPDGRCIFLKGSPEAVLDHCSHQLGLDGRHEALDADAARAAAGELADEGYRVLGMAFGCRDIDQFHDDDPGSELVFAGFQAMEDPVRPEAPDAVKAAQEAGIRVIMLTGDHLRTAQAIGRQLGLGDGRAEEGRQIDDRSPDELDKIVREVSVFARVSPDHKLKLVEQLKQQGHIVAVTGDGVNDAPALQAAHLGVAMGQAGTDVAREASDMVLADDNFASITSAVEEGRIVFANIRKVTYFLLSTGVGLVLVILLSLFGPWPLPFMAAQVLWINLITKGLQDVALAFEAGEPDLLKEPPRDPAEGVINRPVFWRMVWIGVFMAVVTLGVFWWAQQQPGFSLEMTRSIAMTQMVMLQFFHVFNCRSFHRSVFKVPIRNNPYVIGAVLIALLVHLAVLHVGFLQAIFETEPITLKWWAIIVVVSLSILVVAEIDKAFVRRRGRRPNAGREATGRTSPAETGKQEDGGGATDEDARGSPR